MCYISLYVLIHTHVVHLTIKYSYVAEGEEVCAVVLKAVYQTLLVTHVGMKKYAHTYMYTS